MSTLHYSAMTSVIVRVADSVTESSSGKFIMETPQTSGTGPLPAGQWQTDLIQETLCPQPCSPLLSTPLLTTPCSLVLLGSFVSDRLSLYVPLYFPFRWGRLDVSAECLWSACLLTQSHVVKLWHFCPLTFWFLLLNTIHHVLRIWRAGESIFLGFIQLHSCLLEHSWF